MDPRSLTAKRQSAEPEGLYYSTCSFKSFLQESPDLTPNCPARSPADRRCHDYAFLPGDASRILSPASVHSMPREA